eukprot:TRINITY_DN19449_c0_g1_i1.p1 TRINITY_DN19449_c0_g1~~TRINITY_DN19449_c0_g1_i1.p1  ORF type:complete len:194 (+),score=33.44 TRINITY_DN19449_c0_g1_i1:150-731(+)
MISTRPSNHVRVYSLFRFLSVVSFPGRFTHCNIMHETQGKKFSQYELDDFNSSFPISKPFTVSFDPKLFRIERRLKRARRETATAFFSNERTFLRYMHMPGFLAAAGSKLITHGDPLGRWIGISFFVLAVCFALFALRKHLNRFEDLKDLQELEYEEFEDRWGPVVLVCTYCIIVIIIGAYYLSRAPNTGDPE